MSHNPPKHKGCLIALGLSIPVLALLYAYCVFTPTGYEKIEESNRTARQSLLETRFPSRPLKSPTPPSTTPTSPAKSDSPTSGTEALSRFRQLNDREKKWELIVWDTNGFTFPVYPIDSSVSFRMDSSDRVRSPEGQTFALSSAMQERIQKHLQSQYYDSLRLTNMERTLLFPSESSVLGTAEKEKTMDLLETILEEEHWDRLDFFDAAQTNDWKDADRILGSEMVRQTLYRVVRRGDREKADRLIDRYIQLAGKYFFAFGYSPTNNLHSLDLSRFLLTLTAERKVSEETLERIATALASWRLEPEESIKLQTAGLIRSRDQYIAMIKERLNSEPDIRWENTIWYKYPLRIVSKTGIRAAGRISSQAIDRKVTALMQQDTAEYRIANRQLIVARSMADFFDGYRPQWGNDSFDQLILGDGLKIPAPGCESPFEAFGKRHTFLKTFNLYIERFRFLFAAGRYHREHGRYPDSVRDLIPRYLDESFAPTSDQSWIILKIKPLDLILFPEPRNSAASLSQSTRFIHLLNAYDQDSRANSPRGDLESRPHPAGIEDLRPYAEPGEDLSPFAGYFTLLDELPLLGRAWKQEETKEKGKSTRGVSSGEEPCWILSLYASVPLTNLDGGSGYLSVEPEGGNGPGK
jgi:hypothetical protein